MKINKAKLSFLIMLLWTAAIFSFSMQPAYESSRLSIGFGYLLLELLPASLAESVSHLPGSQLGFLHMLLRKAGHFSEYFVLGVLSSISFSKTDFRYRKWLGLEFCVLIAAMDETIQLFVSGRSGQISDVMLDSIGALCGMAVTMVVTMVVMKLLGSRKSRD